MGPEYSCGLRPELARNWSAASQRRFSSVALALSFSEGAIQCIGWSWRFGRFWKINLNWLFANFPTFVPVRIIASLFELLEVEAISRLPDFLIYGALEFQQLDVMSALIGIPRNLRLTGCAFWTCGLHPRLPFLDGLALALTSFRRPPRYWISHRHPPIVC